MDFRQRGISMIELMVAMLISSFLILGVTQVYLDNRSNSLFQQNQSSNIENARFSLLFLEQELAKTGYRRSPDDTMETAFPGGTIGTCGHMDAGSSVKYINATEFCIRYQPAFSGATRCDGKILDNIPSDPYTTPNDAERSYAHFALNGQNLTCNGVEIASNIGALRFSYGVNTLKDEKNISRYTSTPAANEIIRAVKISVLTSSPTEITQTPASTAYEFWFGAAPTDKKLYGLFSTGTSMRNMMP